MRRSLALHLRSRVQIRSEPECEGGGERAFPPLLPISAAALDRLSRSSSISPVGMLPTITASSTVAAGRFSPNGALEK